MVAGLSIQVVSLFVYIALCLDFAVNVYRHRFSLDLTHALVRQSRKFKAFLVGKLSPLTPIISIDFGFCLMTALFFSSCDCDHPHLRAIYLPRS